MNFYHENIISSSFFLPFSVMFCNFLYKGVVCLLLFIFGYLKFLLKLWMEIIFPLHFFPLLFILFFNFTILYWFCHISTWIHHRYTRVPHPEPSSLLPPHTIPLGCPSAPAPSIQYHAFLNKDFFHIDLSMSSNVKFS